MRGPLVLIDPRSHPHPAGRVNWSVVTEGTSETDRRSNARYVISVARKLGCTVFLTWEDLVEVRSRTIMILVASIMALAKQLTSEREGGWRGGAAGRPSVASVEG